MGKLAGSQRSCSHIHVYLEVKKTKVQSINLLGKSNSFPPF